MKQGNVGFSVIEMMVAIAIGAVVTAMAIPNFEQMREIYRLHGATREIFVTLQGVRMTAVKENNRQRFYLVGNTYVVHNDLNNNGVEDVGEPKSQKDIQWNAHGVSLSGMSVATALVFLPNGTATISGGVSAITVQNASGDQKMILVSPAGRIRIN